MREVMDLFEDKVPNTDSSLVQGASETQLYTENLTKTFPCPESQAQPSDLKDSLPGNDNFQFDPNPYPPMGSLPVSSFSDSCPPNLEHLIQESVSKSTARLLTKNALKYLDKDFPVTVGDGVSQQFTVRSPTNKAPGKTTYRKGEAVDLPGANDDGRGAFELLGPVPVDPKISSFKLHKITYEMYKLFDNIKSFEESNRTGTESNYNFVTSRDKTNRTSEKDNPVVESQRLSRKSSAFEEVVNMEPYFESRLKPKPFPSMSTSYPEDHNNFATNSLSRFDNMSLSFTDNNSNRFDHMPLSSPYEPVNSNAVEKSESNAFDPVQERFPIAPFALNQLGSTDFDSKDDSDYPAFSSDPGGNEPVHVEPFKATLTLEASDGDQETVKYSCINKSDFNVSVVSKEDSKAFNANSDSNTEQSKQDWQNLKNKEFKPTFVTRVYAPMDRARFLPKKRAVVVGCNYLGNPDAQLRGSCNDAFVFAQVLVKKFNFDPQNIILLLDASPSAAYTRNLSQFEQGEPPKPKAEGFDFNLDLSRVKPSVVERNVYPTKKTSMLGRHLVERDLKYLSLNENLCLDSTVLPAPPEMHPTRGNVFRSLKWLNFSSCPNDLAVFYFSGQSVQVDDLSGYEGDGFDEALVPLDFEKNGLVTCNDLRCLFQSIGSTCRLSVFFDSCNMQTVVGASSRSGPVKGSKMKGFWPFSEPTGKLNSFDCEENVYKDQRMINQMTRVKFLNTIQVDSVSSLSDVQLSLDAAHGMVNYVVLSSSNLNSVSLECLFKPLNLDVLFGSVNEPKTVRRNYSSFTKGSEEVPKGVRDDEVVVHGAFTYTLLLTLLFDKSHRKGGLGVDELVEGVNKKLSQLRRLRLPRLSQQCEALFYHSSKLPKNSLLFPSATSHPPAKCTDNAYGYLLPEDAWMFMVDAGRQQAREQQQKFERMKTDLITLTNLNNKIFNQNTDRSNLTTQMKGDNAVDKAQKTNRTVNRVMPNSSNGSEATGAFSQGPSPSSVDIPMNGFSTNLCKPKRTGRSMTNNVSARVFGRTSSGSGRGTARSKTATITDPRANTYVPFQGNAGFKFNDVVHTHNWYGGTVVSMPMYQKGAVYNNNPFHHNTGYVNYDGRPLNRAVYQEDQVYYGQFQTMPVYEPITASMLQKLPTTNSFAVFQK